MSEASEELMRIEYCKCKVLVHKNNFHQSAWVELDCGRLMSCREVNMRQWVYTLHRFRCLTERKEKKEQDGIVSRELFVPPLIL